MNRSKKLIDTIYTKTPSDDLSSVMGNVNKLLYQFQTSPQKLPKAASVLEKYALACVKVLNMTHVKLTVTVLVELIKGTREHLSLFEDVIANIITAYCSNPTLEVRLSGISIFIAYVDALDSTSAPASRLDFFSHTTHFINFAKLPTAAAANSSSNNNDNNNNNKLKVAAFQGLSACVRAFELRNAMETFIGKLGPDIVSVILENVHSSSIKKLDENVHGDDVTVSKSKKGSKKETEEKSNNSSASASSSNEVDESVKEISDSALQCMRDLVERLESKAIISLVDSVLQYFDTKNIWTSNTADFAENCLLTILRSIKSTNRYLMAVGIVQRIEKISSGASVAVRSRMFTCLEKVYTEATGLFASVLLLAMNQLAASIASKSDSDEESDFQKNLIQVVSKIAGKVTLSTTKIEGIELIVSKASEHMQKVSSHSSSSSSKSGSKSDDSSETNVVAAFLDLSNELFKSVKRPFSRRPSDAMVNTLLQFTKVESASEVRVGALKLLQIVLSCGQNDEILKSNLSALSGGFMSAISLDDPAVTNGVRVRNTLLESLALSSNKPQHVLEIGNILVILLARLQDREVPFIVPFLFEVQKEACKASHATSLDRARMVLVAACFISIAKIYDVDDLMKIAADALSSLDEADLASRELKIDTDKTNPLVQAHSKWRKPYASDGSMKPVFVREKIVKILAGVKRLDRGYVDLKSLLAAEWKAVADGDIAIEIRVGSSATSTSNGGDSKGKGLSNKGKNAKKKSSRHRKSSDSSDSDSESDSSDSSESDSDDDDGNDSRSHLVSLTKLSSAISISSESISEIPFADCDNEEIAMPIIKKSDVVSYKNVVDVLEGKKSADEILGAKKNKSEAIVIDVDDDGGDDGDVLSFDKIAAACTEYRESTAKTFALVCEDIAEDPKDCKTDLLGDEKIVDPELLDPAKNPDVDMDTFVDSRQHFPQIFQVIKE